MPNINKVSTILIREDTPLPVNLTIESEAFLPGWRVVKNLDHSGLVRNIEGANWNFFYLAGEIRATVSGPDRLGTLRRAEAQEGPNREAERQKKQMDDLEVARQKNRKIFRP